MDLIVPNLFLAGVPKAGTSSLARWMADHPEIEGGTVKELRILIDRDDPARRKEGYWQSGLDVFARYFPAAGTKPAARYRLDASTQYYYQETAKRVISELSQARVIFILRDPVRRMLSLYRYMRNNRGLLPAAMDFSTFVEEVRAGAGSSAAVPNWTEIRDAIEHGKYIRYIEDWVARIGRERLLVYLLDDMQADPRKFMCRLAHDLRIDPAFYRDYNFVRQNESYRLRSRSMHLFAERFRGFRGATPGKRKISPPGTVYKLFKSVYLRLNTMPGGEQLSERDKAALAKLRDDYAPFNAELAAFLGRRDLSW